jgi:hypothetical protein
MGRSMVEREDLVDDEPLAAALEPAFVAVGRPRVVEMARDDDRDWRELELHQAAEKRLRDVVGHPRRQVGTFGRDHHPVLVRVLDDRLIPLGDAVFAVVAPNVDLALRLRGSGARVHDLPVRPVTLERDLR